MYIQPSNAPPQHTDAITYTEPLQHLHKQRRIIADMAPQEVKSKALVLSIPTLGKGPGGMPLFVGACDAPTKIAGTVKFFSNYNCKGDTIRIRYKAKAKVAWSKRSGNKTTHYRGELLFDEADQEMALPMAKEGVVLAGRYECPFEFPVDPSVMPCSSRGTYGSVTYTVVATLVRGFPSTNVVREQTVWVLNSCLPRPQRPLPDAPMSATRFNGTFANNVPYICAIPSKVLYLGQQVPITLKVLPHQFPVQVASAVIKLKQYTTLSVKTGRKIDSKDILNIIVNDGWPMARARESWKRTVVVPLPGAPELTPTVNTAILEKSHKLKLIMQVRVGNSGSREMRVEMPVIITGPRPAGEPYPSFDLSQYLSCVESI
ncbi:hypothetical protein BGZ75_005301 [Mortierella antarctica]|nr:hypothetical protein BGZ75_005301 [Mortierella antarctica]